VVGHTWRFVNKQGGPDRRFNNNAQQPVCLYGELTFTSPGGLNCLLHLSNPEAGERFVKVDEVLRSYDATRLGLKSFKSLAEAKRWPARALVISFLICGIALSAVALWQIPAVRSEIENAFRPPAATSQPIAPVYQPALQPAVTPMARDPAPIPRDRPIRR
jgi:hypothetical protein